MEKKLIDAFFSGKLDNCLSNKSQEDIDLEKELEKSVDVEYYPVDEKHKNVTVNMFDTLNVFMTYFKRLYMRKKNETMFENIDASKVDETNKCLEVFYEHMEIYNKSEYDDKDDLYEAHSINMGDFEELYILNIDDKPELVCRHLIPILMYLSSIEWSEINWTILHEKKA
jgi:hypothetical protein